MTFGRGDQVAKLTLDQEFTTLGGPWEPAYPWSPLGWATEGSWLGNPTLLPPDANPIALLSGQMILSDIPRPADVPAASVGGLSRISGQILTQNTFAQTYGYFEASIQMPGNNGDGGAFWLLPQNGQWPPELDIAEVYGNDPTLLINTLHDGYDDDGSVAHWGSVANTAQGFHTYAVDWEPNTITWYFDGKQTFQTATPADMNQPMYLVFSLNSGTSSTIEGAAAATSVGQMKIDWVHVYDSNPYTTATPPASAAAPATAEPATTADPAIVYIDPTTTMLTAPAGPAFIICYGSGTDTIINGFSPNNEAFDFEMTTADFNSLAISADPGDGHALVDFNGNHISLPGVMPDQLSSNNFLDHWQTNSNL